MCVWGGSVIGVHERERERESDCADGGVMAVGVERRGGGGGGGEGGCWR